jgi:hypothetical protein
MASNGHDKYGRYHDMFYNRARNYLETDELRVSHPRQPSRFLFPPNLATGLWRALHILGSCTGMGPCRHE